MAINSEVNEFINEQNDQEQSGAESHWKLCQEYLENKEKFNKSYGYNSDRQEPWGEYYCRSARPLFNAKKYKLLDGPNLMKFDFDNNGIQDIQVKFIVCKDCIGSNPIKRYGNIVYLGENGNSYRRNDDYALEADYIIQQDKSKKK